MINNKPIISIIIPAFNAENTLRRCLDSVFRQNLDKRMYEVIVVDDCSKDRTAEIAKLYLHHPRFVFIKNARKSGVSRARWVGVEASQGYYISFVDADDEIVPEMLLTLYESIIKNRAEIACAGYMLMGLEKTRVEIGYKDMVMNQGEAIQKLIIERNYGGVTNKLINKEIVKYEEVCKTFGRKYAEDILFMAYILQEAKTIAFVSKPLYRYWLRPDSSSQSPSLMALSDYFYCHKKIFKMFSEQKWNVYNEKIELYYFNALINGWCQLKQTSFVGNRKIKMRKGALARCKDIPLFDFLKAKPSFKTIIKYLTIRVGLFEFLFNLSKKLKCAMNF